MLLYLTKVVRYFEIITLRHRTTNDSTEVGGLNYFRDEKLRELSHGLYDLLCSVKQIGRDRRGAGGDKDVGLNYTQLDAIDAIRIPLIGASDGQMRTVRTHTFLYRMRVMLSFLVKDVEFLFERTLENTTSNARPTKTRLFRTWRSPCIAKTRISTTLSHMLVRSGAMFVTRPRLQVGVLNSLIEQADEQLLNWRRSGTNNVSTISDL